MATRSCFSILMASVLALLGAVNASAQGLSIDDFTSGPTKPGSFTLRSTGMSESSQFGLGILGGTRGAYQKHRTRCIDRANVDAMNVRVVFGRSVIRHRLTAHRKFAYRNT